MGCVFGVSVKVSFKPVSSATETIWKIEISPVESLHIKLSKKRITKALIRLRRCAGWSAPVLFSNPGFSHVEDHIICCFFRCPVYHNLPTDCTLVAQPGQCCLKPLCNFQPTVDSQQSSGHGKTQDGIGMSI